MGGVYAGWIAAEVIQFKTGRDLSEGIGVSPAMRQLVVDDPVTGVVFGCCPYPATRFGFRDFVPEPAGNWRFPFHVLLLFKTE
jgi:hypothetical protein